MYLVKYLDWTEQEVSYLDLTHNAWINVWFTFSL